MDLNMTIKYDQNVQITGLNDIINMSYASNFSDFLWYENISSD